MEHRDHRIRCPWAGPSQRYIDYHDQEWGRPLHDERRLFAMLLLEGQQAGLSWLTILNKRENFYRAYDGFDPEKIAAYDAAKAAALMQDAGIIRNRLKIGAAVQNAQAYLRLAEQEGSLDAYLWGFVGGAPLRNHWRSMQEVPASTALSDVISKDLKRRGFRFVGSTIIYAYMQSIGMVNDHLTSCFLHTDSE